MFCRRITITTAQNVDENTSGSREKRIPEKQGNDLHHFQFLYSKKNLNIILRKRLITFYKVSLSCDIDQDQSDSSIFFSKLDCHVTIKR